MEEEKIITESDWKLLLSNTPYQYIRNLKNQLIVGVKNFNIFNKLLYNYAFDSNSRFYSGKQLSKDNIIYRARTYFKEEDDEPIKNSHSSFRGYNEKGSFIPPIEKCKEGRVNRDGIRFLYTASDIKTAISEINPSLGNEVSVAEIRIDVRLFLNIFCLAIWNLGIEAGDENKTSWINSFFLDIAQCFYSVNTKKEDYILCQYIAEYVKKLGFDGIAYYSSKNKSNLDIDAGINYAIFNYEKCKPISSKIYYIEDIKIDYFEVNK